MNLQQMKYVIYTAKYNSFSKAAKELFVTQPNISNAIKELEQELKRSDSISRLAKNITDTADLTLKASKHIHEISGSNIALPMFGDKYE